MELSLRRQDILKEVVERYISNGEPVGSKALQEALGGISSATIRNEMSALEEINLLCHPHTSAGRIPTLGGFRFYIDKLMDKCDVGQNQKELFNSLLPEAFTDKKQAIRFATGALSQATKCTVLLTDRTDALTTVHKVDLVPIGGRGALIMLITSAGRVLSRTYRFSSLITEGGLNAFLKLADQSLVGKTIGDIQPAELQTAVAQSGEYALEIAPMISALSELIEEAGESKLELFGESNLLSCADYSITRARDIFSLLTRKDDVLNLLEIWGKESGVILGGDTPYRALETASIVISKYNAGEMSGYVGIIGPTKMDYKSVLPGLEYFASLLTKGTV